MCHLEENIAKYQPADFFSENHISNPYVLGQYINHIMEWQYFRSRYYIVLASNKLKM